MWIETNNLYLIPGPASVAPHAGVWIETVALPGRLFGEVLKLSHPMRVCGLKPAVVGLSIVLNNVAPHAGVWIETILMKATKYKGKGRTPCGCVD